MPLYGVDVAAYLKCTNSECVRRTSLNCTCACTLRLTESHATCNRCQRRSTVTGGYEPSTPRGGVGGGDGESDSGFGATAADTRLRDLVRQQTFAYQQNSHPT